MALFALAALAATVISPDTMQARAIAEAIGDEIEYGIEATIAQDIDRYMETVPADYRIVEDDDSVTDRERLCAKQLPAWAIIPRTNALEIEIERVEPGCEGACATVWTSQRWDRQMIGRDGASEHNVVTTQRHVERWEERGSRWVNVSIEELGGTVTVDGESYR